MMLLFISLDCQVVKISERKYYYNFTAHSSTVTVSQLDHYNHKFLYIIIHHTVYSLYTLKVYIAQIYIIQYGLQ